MHLVIEFDKALEKPSMDFFLACLLQETKRWGGFRGRRIGPIVFKPADLERSTRMHLNLGYNGEPEGEEEIIEAFRDTLAGERILGLGGTRVRAISRP